MTPTGAPLPPCAPSSIPVVLDGRLLGEVGAECAQELAVKLRTLKALGQDKVHKKPVEQYIIRKEDFDYQLEIEKLFD